MSDILAVMPLRRWDSDESTVEAGPLRYDPTSSCESMSTGRLFYYECKVKTSVIWCLRILKHYYDSAVCNLPRLSPALRSSAESDADSSEDSCSDDCSDSESCVTRPAVVDLTLERIQSLQSNPDDGDSVFSRSGSSKSRVVDALRNPCCKCRCQVPLGILMKLVTAFWSLSKTMQDGLLWSLQAGQHKKRQWFIQGTGA